MGEVIMCIRKPLTRTSLFGLICAVILLLLAGSVPARADLDKKGARDFAKTHGTIWKDPPRLAIELMRANALDDGSLAALQTAFEKTAKDQETEIHDALREAASLGKSPACKEAVRIFDGKDPSSIPDDELEEVWPYHSSEDDRMVVETCLRGLGATEADVERVFAGLEVSEAAGAMMGLGLVEARYPQPGSGIWANASEDVITLLTELHGEAEEVKNLEYDMRDVSCDILALRRTGRFGDAQLAALIARLRETFVDFSIKRDWRRDPDTVEREARESSAILDQLLDQELVTEYDAGRSLMRRLVGEELSYAEVFSVLSDKRNSHGPMSARYAAFTAGFVNQGEARKGARSMLRSLE